MPKVIQSSEKITSCNCQFDCKCAEKSCLCDESCKCGTNCSCVTKKNGSCSFPENHECKSSDFPEAKVCCCGANCKCEVNCNCVTNKDGFCSCTENSVFKSCSCCSDDKTKACCCGTSCRCDDNCQNVANQDGACGCPENVAFNSSLSGCTSKGFKCYGTKAGTCCCCDCCKCGIASNFASDAACDDKKNELKCYCEGDKEVFTCEADCKCQLCISGTSEKCISCFFCTCA